MLYIQSKNQVSFVLKQTFYNIIPYTGKNHFHSNLVKKATEYINLITFNPDLIY